MNFRGLLLTSLVVTSTTLGCKSSDSKSSSSSNDSDASSGGGSGASTGGLTASSNGGSANDATSGGNGGSSGGVGGASVSGSAGSSADSSDSGGSGGSDSETAEASSSGGGGGSGGSPGVDVTIESCDDLGAQACARLNDCAPFLLQAYYGDEATCRNLFGETCSASAAGQPSFARCAEQLTSCDFIRLSQGVPAGCFQPAGEQHLGDSCSSDEECAEGLCGRTKEDEAGTCLEPSQAGGSCALPARCALGLKCNPIDYICIAPSAEGNTCSSAIECETGLTCDEQGSCRPTEMGDPCSTLVPCMPGQVCVDECLEIPWSEDGDCRAGQQCEGTERCLVRQTGSFEQTAECAPAGGFGDTCGDTTTCLEPLVCRSGKCDI